MAKKKPNYLAWGLLALGGGVLVYGLVSSSKKKGDTVLTNPETGLRVEFSDNPTTAKDTLQANNPFGGFDFNNA